MTPTTKPAPNGQAAPCRCCAEYWTPGGMLCRECIVAAFKVQETINAQAKPTTKTNKP